MDPRGPIVSRGEFVLEFLRQFVIFQGEPDLVHPTPFWIGPCFFNCEKRKLKFDLHRLILSHQICLIFGNGNSGIERTTSFVFLLHGPKGMLGVLPLLLS